jgi:putative lipoic acid-binding regulatory protein
LPTTGNYSTIGHQLPKTCRDAQNGPEARFCLTFPPARFLFSTTRNYFFPVTLATKKAAQHMTDYSADDSTGNQCHPKISYPCAWEYRVIGTDRQRLREIIMSACEPAMPTIRDGNSSSHGRYCSVNATVEVSSEDMRLAIFARISNNPEIKLVI